MQLLNISGYHFVPIIEPAEIKKNILDALGDKNIKGTILVAPEGLNLFLSGPEKDCLNFVDHICAVVGIGPKDLDMKLSWSEEHAFNRFLVRLKKETIAFDYPYQHKLKAPYISPKELKEDYLSKNPNLIVIDTRNQYETELGSFEGAVIPPINSFKEFKAFAAEHAEEWKNKKVVTFCTGGIRCEKAATFLKGLGCDDVYQLHGGILRYFEEEGGAFYEGDCFVFDKRVALRPDLSISNVLQCYACRHTLKPTDCESVLYIPGVSCPYCASDGESK